MPACEVDGDRAGGGFRNGNKVQKLGIGQPAVGKHFLAHHGDHAVSAAKADSADFKEGQKKLQINHLPSPSVFFKLPMRYTVTPSTALMRI